MRENYGPLIGSAVGMLLGGVALAALGALAGSEFATCCLAAAGMIGGSAAGSHLGSHRRATIVSNSGASASGESSSVEPISGEPGDVLDGE